MGSNSHGYSPQLSVADKVISAHNASYAYAGPSVFYAVVEYVCSTVAFHILVQIFIPLFETKCVGSK